MAQLGMANDMILGTPIPKSVYQFPSMYQTPSSSYYGFAPSYMYPYGTGAGWGGYNPYGGGYFNAPQVPQVYDDPSAVGGVCRQKCHAAPNPVECCRIKAGVPGCHDSDCAGAAYTGTTPAPPGVFAQYPQYPQLTQYPQLAQYASNPYYGLSGLGGVTATTYPYGTAFNQATWGTSSCNAWPPCNTQANPGECCRSKPVTCYDADCIGGSYVGKPVYNVYAGVPSLPAAGGIVYNGTGAYGYGGYGGYGTGGYSPGYSGFPGGPGYPGGVPLLGYQASGYQGQTDSAMDSMDETWSDKYD